MSSKEQLTVESDSSSHHTNVATSLIRDVLQLKWNDWKTLLQALRTGLGAVVGKPMDDRELLLENLVVTLQTLPEGNRIGDALSNRFIEFLWSDLIHPPASRMGPTAVYRSADGSGNCIEMPELGKSGMPYARNVAPQAVKSRLLPDPELMFDTLLRRDGASTFKEQQGGLNRLFFAQAVLIIHDLFVPLYGSNEEQQAQVRTYIQGRIHPDTIALDRLMLMSPPVIALLIMFSRHHNRLVEQLFEVNEQGKYKPWIALDEEGRKWQDNDLFQLARNINVAFFAKTVLCDYVSVILGTVQQNTDWHLELGKEIKGVTQTTKRGGGNVVSVEFLAMYRWHATLSKADVAWIEDTFRRDLPGKDIHKLDYSDFYGVLGKKERELHQQPNNEWTFGGLKRNEDGYFDDDDLAKILKDAIEEPAHEFGGRSVPDILRIAEVAGIKQCRDVFNLCTMNEFRHFLGLTTFSTFEEWNSNPEIANKARELYGHIDDLELYIGLQCEENKPNVPGSGLQPGHTLARGILSDAVTLIRSDRFLSHDLNATTLTQQGMALLKPAQGSYGGFLPHILYNSLPNSWGQSNAYALLPFYTPKAARQILASNGVLDHYSIGRPDNALKVHLVDHETASLCADETLAYLFKENVSLVAQLQGGVDESVLNRASGALSGSVRRSFDAIKDLLSVVVMRWSSSMFGLSSGNLEVETLHDTLAQLNAFMAEDFDAAQHFELQDLAQKAAPGLHNIIGSVLDRSRAKPYHLWTPRLDLPPEARQLYVDIYDLSVDEKDQAVGILVVLMISVTATLSHLAALALDAILSSEHKKTLEQLATSDNEGDVQAFITSIRAWLQTSIELVVAYKAEKNTLVEQQKVRANEWFLVSSVGQPLDDAQTLKIGDSDKRVVFSLLLWNATIKETLFVPAISAMLREILKLKSLAGAKGLAGSLSPISQPLGQSELKRTVYLDDKYLARPFPSSLVVECDP
ncbi:heme peroxidase [Acaromyces ingoldii]|uniref:Heme peroxidase n=1 Tax=Acaromyces ingoldii TaxID=215250 RepID=A0A316YTN5_9BASI|nr:heme peroxidase [Acaromyces ingoldii]PWN92018.1 heme peroxidase [Acaromyces ingoldii]